MSIKITANFEGVLKDFDDLKRHIRNNAEFGAEKALKISIKKLQAELLDLVNNQVKLNPTNKKPDGSPAEPLPANLNIPKTKADIVKHIFNEDLTKADYYQKSLGNHTINDNSNVFVLKNKRIKAYQTINDSSTYEGEETKFKNRIASGIIIDAVSGLTLKVNPKDVKGIKVECSTDVGETIKSDKKLQAYKASDKMTRTKNNSTQRLAVWTIKQADVQTMVHNAISVDKVVEKILEEDYQTAKTLLEKVNTDKALDSSVKKVEDLEKSKAVPNDVQAIMEIQKLIKNLRVEKDISKKDTTQYILVTDYNDSNEQNVKFIDAITQQIKLWTLTEQEGWFKSIVDQVIRALSKYDQKAKFK